MVSLSIDWGSCNPREAHLRGRAIAIVGGGCRRERRARKGEKLIDGVELAAMEKLADGATQPEEFATLESRFTCTNIRGRSNSTQCPKKKHEISIHA